MPRAHTFRILLCLALLGAASTSARRAGAQAAAGLTKDQQAAASRPAATGGKVPLRVMLVVSDALRGYKVHEGLVHLDFGGRLARKAEKNFEDTFASVQVVAEAPAVAHPPVGIDLIVSIESPHGWDKFSGIFSVTENLSVVFVARRPSGEEIFREQESASEDGNRAATQDRLGDAVSRQGIQNMLLSPAIRDLLSGGPAVSTKAENSDSSMLGSGGLEMPPPPPPEIAAGTGDGDRAGQLELDERP